MDSKKCWLHEKAGVNKMEQRPKSVNTVELWEGRVVVTWVVVYAG